MSRPSRNPWWLAPLTVLATLVPLLAVTAPAHAADDGGPMPTNCTGAYDCIYINPLALAEDEGTVPSNEAWDIVPVLTDPSAGDGGSGDGSGGGSSGGGTTFTGPPWQGTFLIRQHSTASDPDPDNRVCMASRSNQQLVTCAPQDQDQRWYIEPIGSPNIPVTTDPSSPSVWNPFDDAFYLRSADDDHPSWCYGSQFGDLHADRNDGDTYAKFKKCTDIDHQAQFEWTMSRTSPNGTTINTGDPYTPAEKAELSTYVLGSALAHALAACNLNLSSCSAQLYDSNKGANVSDWSKMDSLKVTSAPSPVLINNACAAGNTGDDGSGPGTARVLYNGGDAPMSATLGASGTNGFSTSLTTGLSTTVSTSWDAVVASGSVSVTASVEYGHTWSKSFTTSQDVNWTIPPHHYATATLSSSALQLVARWRFNQSSASGTGTLFNPWYTDGFTRMTVPYSADGSADQPDAVLAVYNTWDRKSCSASAPSHLAPDAILDVTNDTHPDTAPIVGDTLRAVADASQWVTPSFSTAPVVLRYQWYRQRASQAAEAINNAHGATYTVTEDDTTDDEMLDRYGPYHLFVGVTDVSDQYRFDSPEYTSLSTGAVYESDSGAPTIGDTELSLDILNPDVHAGTDTIVDVSASATGSPTSPSGTVTIRDNDAVIGDPVTLGAEGTARVRLRLPRGQHILEAVYEGDGTFSGARSAVARTDIDGADSRTSVELAHASSSVAQATYATVRVAPTETADVTPTGSVRLLASGRTIGDPVTLRPDGTARIRVPASPRAGARQITARYAGDDVFEPSTSPAVTQYVSTVRTHIRLHPRTRVAYRGGVLPIRVVVTAASAGTPQGRVRFLVDGRGHGRPVLLNTAGRARLRVKGLAKGFHRVTVRYLPNDHAHAASTSRTVRIHVRRHGLRVGIASSRARLGRHGRLIVTGRVRMIGSGPAIGHRKVILLRDGRAIRAARVDAHGRYRLAVPGTRLQKGDNEVRVRCQGSRRLSIAPGLSRALTIQRR